jgi:hypothetical protein
MKSRDALRTLKLANIALAGLASLGVLFGLLFVIVGLFGEVEGDKGGAAMFVLYGLIMSIGFAALAVAHVYTGFMVTAGRARAMQTTLATLHLATFPLGTLYALYAMWVCWIDPETSKIFDHPGGRRVS